MKLENQVILITGGTSGIGRELGKALLSKGNEVILLGRNEKELASAKKLGFATISCDLTNIESVKRAVKTVQTTHPKLSVLFNNAGIQHNYLFVEEKGLTNKITQEVATNVTGQIMLTQLLLPVLLAAKNSIIVNTTSGLGAYPKTNGLVYSASKAAMRNFTKGLRDVLRNSPIKVVEFIPPVTSTAMTSGRKGKMMTPEALVKHALPMMEQGKSVVTTAKMRLFLFLASCAPYLTRKILSD